MPKSGPKSYFIKSPENERIMACIDRNIGKMPNSELYEKIKKIDSKIPEKRAFDGFMEKIETARQSKALMLLQQLQTLDSKEDEKSDRALSVLLKGIHMKLMGLGDAVLEQEVQEVVALVQTGQRIPALQRERIMGWLFRGLKQQAESKLIDLKINADVRAETIFDHLFKAAQYGKVKETDVVTGEFEEVKGEVNV
jgi:uncharacterized protein YaaR (DUF327 family)